MKTTGISQLAHRYFMAAALVPTLVLGGYAYSTQTAEYLSDLTASVRHNMEAVRITVDDFDRQNRSVLKSFSRSEELQGLNSETPTAESLEKVMAGYASDFNQVDRVFVGLQDGRFYTSEEAVREKAPDPRFRPWYHLAMKSVGTIVMSDAYDDAVTDFGRVVTYSVQIFGDRAGQLIGVAGSDVSLTDLEYEINRVWRLEASTLIIAEGTGFIVVGSRNALRDSLEKRPGEIQRLIGLKSYGETVVDGIPYILHGRKCLSTNWYILSLTPRSVLKKTETYVLGTTAVSMVMLLLVSWVMSHVLNRRLTRPFERIASSIREADLTEGRSDVAINPQAPLEIQQVEKSFAELLQRLGKQAEELGLQKQEIQEQYQEINALYEQTAAMNETLNDLVRQLRQSNRETIQALSNAIEAKDIYTKGHCDRVTEISLLLGEAAGLDSRALETLELAGMLHDVGKVAVHSHILTKPGPLTPEEFDSIRQHPENGYAMLRGIPFLEEPAQLIRQHHERMDGTGYPFGLAGGEILLGARILSIADAYDAMTSARAYRRTPLSAEEAIAQLEAGAGTQFDPLLVGVMRQLTSEGRLAHETDNAPAAT